MKTYQSIFGSGVIVAGSILLVSCGGESNPANETKDAKVSDAVDREVVTSENAVKYVVTDDSEVEFIGSKKTISPGEDDKVVTHDGGFTEVSGHLMLLDGQPAGNDHRIEISMDSVYSDDEKLTGHLKSEDFFDVETYPRATFEVTSIESIEDNLYTVTGNLDLHGVVKAIEFEAEMDVDGDEVSLEAEFDINRHDWDISYRVDLVDTTITDEVVIRFDITAEALEEENAE